MAQAKKKVAKKKVVKKANSNRAPQKAANKEQIYRLKAVRTAPFEHWSINLNQILQPKVTDPQKQLLLVPINKTSKNHPKDPGTPTATFIRLTEAEAEKVREYLKTTIVEFNTAGLLKSVTEGDTFNPFEHGDSQGQNLSHWIRLQKWTKPESQIPWNRSGEYMIRIWPKRFEQGKGEIVSIDKFNELPEDDEDDLDDELNSGHINMPLQTEAGLDDGSGEDTTLPKPEQLEQL